MYEASRAAVRAAAGVRQEVPLHCLGHLAVLCCLAAGCAGPRPAPAWDISGVADDGGADGQVAADGAPQEAAPAGDGAAEHGLPLPDGPAAADSAGVQCVASKVETRSCGDCQTGKQQRTCSAAGVWGPWTGCSGAQSGFPFHPGSKQLVCPPYTNPAVFFSPHPDDESIAMGGAIVEHVKAGQQVFIEVMTHGEASGVYSVLTGLTACAWHGTTHSYALSKTQFGQARVAEVTDVAARLGVAGIQVSDFGDLNLSTAEVGQRRAFWLKWAPGTRFKGIIGISGISGTNGHPDHVAVWTALTTSGLTDVRGYTSTFFVPTTGKPVVKVSIAAVCSAKKNALDAYKLWSPTAGRYAIGYHSVAGTINAVTASCEENILYFIP